MLDVDPDDMSGGEKESPRKHSETESHLVANNADHLICPWARSKVLDKHAPSLEIGSWRLGNNIRFR